MGNICETERQSCDSAHAVESCVSSDMDVIVPLERSINRQLMLAMCSGVGLSAVAGCSFEPECSGRHFDCNDAHLSDPNVTDYEYERDVPKTDETTKLSSSIEQTTENAFDTGLDVAKGASLLIVPWIVVALISKGEENGKISEKFYESLLLAGWGALFLALTDDKTAWMAPVILTAFVSAGAAWTPHKKKIMAASELAALIYMVIAATNN